MEELGSIWSYEETMDELKQKLWYTTIELESLKAEAAEEMRKHTEDVKYLINLLKIAYQERDEAIDKLQKLLNSKFMPSSLTTMHTNLPHSRLESPLVMPAKPANSSITESNSLSADTYNHQSHGGSSPVDSFFEPVTSPDFSSISIADSSHMGLVNKTFAQDYNASIATSLLSPSVAKIDAADAIIDNLVKGKTLPVKGKLLQTVMEAGPLLQTLVVAGPLPRWRNPPPLQQFKIPPVLIKDCETANVSQQKPAANSTFVVRKALSSSSYVGMSRGSPQTCSASMLNFGSGGSRSGIGNGWLLNSGAINQIPAGKRQKLR